MSTPPIDEWAGSAVGYYVDRHWDGTDWQREAGPIRLAPYHRRILGHCFRMATNGRLPYDTVCLCECAKSGKTAMLALIQEWFALHVEAPAEQYVISNKQDQAQSRAFRALCQSVRLNPYLKRSPLKYELTFKNGTVVKAIPCNARTEAGANFTLASIDEPWGIVHEDGVRLVAEFKPDPTRNACCRVFAGYAGFAGESALWADLLDIGLKGQPVPELRDIDDGRGQPACWANGGVFVFWSHVPRQPWQTPKWLASMEATRTPGEFARQVHCDFSASEESFVPEAWWDACYDPELEPLRPGDHTPLVVAVDASQSHDCTAIVGCSRHPKRHDQIAVRFVQVWDPKTQPGGVIDHERTIIPTIKWLFANFNPVCVVYDPWQLAATMGTLRKSGLGWFKEFQQGDGTTAQPGRTLADVNLRTLIQHRHIWHSGDATLKAHVMASAAKVTGESKLRITRKGREAIDACVALSMSAQETGRLSL